MDDFRTTTLSISQYTSLQRQTIKRFIFRWLEWLSASSPFTYEPVPKVTQSENPVKSLYKFLPHSTLGTQRIGLVLKLCAPRCYKSLTCNSSIRPQTNNFGSLESLRDREPELYHINHFIHPLDIGFAEFFRSVKNIMNR